MKHIADQFELNLTKDKSDKQIDLPPKWKVEQNSSFEFLYLNDKNIVELTREKDDDFARKFCWAIYNKIDGK